MHVPQVWCDRKSSFCIVTNLGIWGTKHDVVHLHGISPAKWRYIKTARASSSQQVVVVVLVVLRGQWARSRGVLLLMAHIRNKLLAKNKNMLVCSVPIEGTVYTDPFRWASIRACSVTLFPIFADQKQFSCYRKYWRNEKDRNKSSQELL